VGWRVGWRAWGIILERVAGKDGVAGLVLEVGVEFYDGWRDYFGEGGMRDI
jgi:hypothetical protein